MGNSNEETLTLPTGKTIKIQTGLFIDNEFVESVDGKRFVTIDPSTEGVITTVAEASSKDVDLAVEAATKAFSNVWCHIDGKERGKLLNKLADLMERNLDDLAALETLDNGKAFSITKTIDLPEAIRCYRYFAGWCDKVHGKVIETQNDKFCYTRNEPLGVCGAIVPWNFPISLMANKIAPALACGNTVILKTAEQTPLSSLKVAELCKEAGFPKGVINVLSGFGSTGTVMANHMKIDMITFTGSTEVGKSIQKAAAESNLKRVLLELGGKSPSIIFADSNLDTAVKFTFNGSFFNHGQFCVAATRIYVEEHVYDEFLKKFKTDAEAIKIGNPFESKIYQGPQISRKQFDRIMSYIKTGKEEGATLLMGGERHGERGFYIKPTIFTDVIENMTIMQDEIFGPVTCIAKFKTIDEVIEKANLTKYGLAAAVFTNNIIKAVKLSKEIKAGTVWVNQYMEGDSSL
ncbi:putative aldehyde dehydrogenase [Gigaspora margarita]|nr:putative aldehyde dehydrogenase [Gigaspora margarita]